MVSASAPHLSRGGLRDCTSRPVTSPPPPQTTRRLGSTRRRHSTDNVFVTERDDTSNQENRHQKATSVDIIHTQTLESKKPTDVLLELEFTFNIPRAGAVDKKSTSSLPTLALCELKTLDGGPLADLNVGHTNVGTHTTTNSFYLDDLSRWDMDCIPTAPLSNSRSSFFSGHIDDETFYDSDVPFPLSRHSNVVLENMRVKKAKTLAKARSAATATPAREIYSKVDPPLFSYTTNNELPGLPHPLPLQTLCPNTDTRRKLNPPRPPNPSVTRKDSYGITHLGSADCELSVVFPNSSHFEVWDMGDDALIACPVVLSISAKNPSIWIGVPISVPQVSLIELRCEDSPFPSAMSKYDASQEYAVTYTGSRTGTSTDDQLSDATRNPKSKAISRDGISIEGRWTRVYAKMGYFEDDSEDGEEDHTPRWNLQVWIPIPTRLFEKRETRAFNINARIWMMGDERRALSLDDNMHGKVTPLLTDAEMTVSHLRMEREMQRVAIF